MLTQSMMLKTVKPSPMFQKRHYDWLANWMAAERPADAFYELYGAWLETRDALVRRLEEEAKQSGTNFKPAKFREACNA